MHFIRSKFLLYAVGLGKDSSLRIGAMAMLKKSPSATTVAMVEVLCSG